MIYASPRSQFRRFEVLRRVRSGERFLEIGPGNLGLAVDLLGKFTFGTVLDFNPRVAEIYERLDAGYKRRLRLLVADFMSTDQLDNGYDCVVACEVLEHVEEDGRFVRKVHGLLASEGQLILSVPSRMNLWSIDDIAVGHFRRYEKQEIRRLLREQGFTSIEIVSYGFPFLNLLRFPRKLWAARQIDGDRPPSMAERSRQSGLVEANWLLKFMTLVVNRWTVIPFATLSKLFNDRDLSDGYVISARKPAHHNDFANSTDTGHC